MMDSFSIDGFDGNLRLVSAADINEVFALESESYPHDEAAPLESLKYRQREANSLFLGYYENASGPCAYVCGTRYYGPRFRIDSMRNHVPDAECVCVHSVVVHPCRQNQGLGTKLVMAYVDHVRKSQANVEKILLLCKKPLVPFYTRCGFTYVDEADLKFGEDTWHEMKLCL